MSKAVGGIFALFMALFLAVVIEETFLGGRRRRKLERKARVEQKAREELAGD